MAIAMGGLVMVLLLGSAVMANPLEGCHNLLKPICNVEWPSSQCCSALKELPRPCLCNAMKHDVSFALPTLAKHCGTQIQCHAFKTRHSKHLIRGGFSVKMGLELGGVERQCRDERLESCYSDVDEGRRPSRQCCNDLHRIPRECVCEVINRESRLSSPQYIERSLRLPRQCGIRVDCRDEQEEEEEEEEEDEPEARLRLGLRVRRRGEDPARQQEEEEEESEEAEQQRRREEQEAERRRREEEEGGREEEECRPEDEVSLQSCYEAIQSPTSSPSPSCCNALRQLRAPCRIRAIRRDPLLRQHPERASRLLQQCSLDARI